MSLNFNQLKESKGIKKLQEFENDFHKLPEVGFKISYNIKEENFAEKLVEEIKNDSN